MASCETRTAFSERFLQSKVLKFVDCLSEFVELCQFYKQPLFILYKFGNQRVFGQEGGQEGRLTNAERLHSSDEEEPNAPEEIPQRPDRSTVVPASFGTT